MKITKKYLHKVINEEINRALNEEPRIDTPRDAHLRGSKYSRAGRYIGAGGKEAFRRDQCKKSWKIHGQWVVGMGDCQALLDQVDDDDQAPGDQSAVEWRFETEDRVARLEARLRKAGIE